MKYYIVGYACISEGNIIHFGSISFKRENYLSEKEIHGIISDTENDTKGKKQRSIVIISLSEVNKECWDKFRSDLTGGID